ncbi:hypothetical protein BWI96_12025, partial [Siphonobacter sp. SORGH_AS_0500]|uniref:T9SS type A sorting domain-containing protein n=1 Tax=Siphonobacter sp. SORGH_AS_0500 TaxID=1864824 RepID=UPI000CA68584
DRLVVASISGISGQASTKKRVTISNPYSGNRTYLWYIYRDSDMQYIGYGTDISSSTGVFDVDLASYNLVSGTVYRLYVGDTGDSGNSRHGYNTFTIGNTPPVDNACNYTNNQLLGSTAGKDIYVKIIGNCKYIAFEPGGESRALDWLYVLVNNGGWASGVTPLTSAQIPTCFKQPGEGCTTSSARIAATSDYDSIKTQGALLLVPNPAQTTVELRLYSDQSIQRATISDMQGRIVKTTAENRIDIQALIPGSYIVSVLTSYGGVYQQLLIKN